MLIERLSKESGISLTRLRYFAKTASQRYYVFSIPKASGGYRQIAHPARPLKSVQRWINHQYFSQLPVHLAAMAYRKGLNIRANALKHVGTNFTLRVDFRDFFPSFQIDHVKDFLKASSHTTELTLDDINFLSQIVSRNGGLTIGAPTSPYLTNAMMYGFDQKFGEFCDVNDLIFTRYADDIFVSTNRPNILSEAYLEIDRIAQEFEYANLQVNRRKTAFLSKRYHREVTGLVLTPDGKVSLGRGRKREIKAMVHAFLLDKLTQDRVGYLKGLLSFASDAEPAFYGALVAKYGEDALEILKFNFNAPNVFGALESLDQPPETP